MELPKNITQIGEADRRCKIYVEDYVISYIRQINHLAENKNVGLALYGIQKEEGEVRYLFFYGACKLDMLQREVRHLSQAQMQEIEKLRKKFFPDYQFLGYRLLNGEMVEGFHVCEQGICRYITGYACFYEKNDAMLAYMLDSRGEEAEPEKVDQEKYERVRVRQETRRQEYQSQMKQAGKGRDSRKETYEEQPEAAGDQGKNQRASQGIRSVSGVLRQVTGEREKKRIGNRREQNVREGRSVQRDRTAAPAGTMHMMRLSVAGMFLLLCVVGLATLYDNGGIEGIQSAAERMWEQLAQKQLPDSEDALSAMNPSGLSGTLYAEDNLTDALQKENAAHTQAPGDSKEEQETGQQDQENLPEKDDPTGDGQASGTGQPDNIGQPGGGPGDGQQTDGQQGNGQPEGSQTDGQQGGEQQTDGQPEDENGQMDEGQGSGETGQTGQNSAESQPANDGQQPQSPEDAVQTSSPITYIVQKGDTLTGISVSHYGTDKRVRDICELNNISNPDDIFYGQKILLP